MNTLKLVGRKYKIFDDDINKYKSELKNEVKNSSFLILGGAGSIGLAVTKEILLRNPKKIHIVDISENNLVELVRDIRNTFNEITSEFKTFALDIASSEYDYFMKSDGKYDYVLNLSALKHVRSEKDHFTLMRMIEVNILNTIKTIKYSIENGSKKYFCVSTDKASIPVNMMGASKKIMEMFLMKFSDKLKISTSRFANVAFSDGSLLYSFKQRLKKQQPIVAPNDVKRYFILPKEAGELCLMSCIFGDNRDVFFPKMDRNKNLISFSDIAINFLREMDYEPIIYSSEKEVLSHKKIKNKWPCFFTKSDTTGEKYIEEFYSKDENLNLNLFKDIGVIKNSININNKKLDNFLKKISSFRKKSNYNKIDIVKLFEDILTDFKHIEKNKFLDSKL